jgi:hypothetical protein
VQGGVAADPAVINCLRYIFRFGVVFQDRIEITFGLGPALSGESETGEAHFKVSSELSFRQIALKPPAFFAFGVEDQDGRCPKRVETAKVFAIFLDVYAERDEILVNE